MKILTSWLRTYVPEIAVDDHQLAEDLTLRGIAVEGVQLPWDGNGHLFEMDITTNRVDAMNHYASRARRRRSITCRWRRSTPRCPLPGPRPRRSRCVLKRRSSAAAFTARVLRNVTIAPAAAASAGFFDLLGQKQISNAVDASNFTLLGMGHPTHAFDLDKIEGGIVVRLARKASASSCSTAPSACWSRRPGQSPMSASRSRWPASWRLGLR